MLHGHAVAELRCGSAAGGNESLARRVRNQMQMKELFLVFHVIESGLLMAVDKVPTALARLSLSGKNGDLSTALSRAESFATLLCKNPLTEN
jgi:hypothetical protein